MTELERELRGLAAAIAFPETPEIAANLRLTPRPERLRRPRRSWRTAAVVRRRRARRCRRGRAGGAAGANVDPALVRDRRGPDRVRRPPARSPARRAARPRRPRSTPPTRRSRCSGPPSSASPTASIARATSSRCCTAPGSGCALSSRRSRTRASRPRSARSSLEAGTRVEFVPIRGSAGPALWITGEPHVVLLPGGPGRLAANTLIWTRGRLTLRLEGAETLQQARAIAESFG